MAFYRRNIGRVHQVVRIGLGMGIAVTAFVVTSGISAWFVAANGIAFALTGVIGWCPACAAVDRVRKG